MLCKFIGTPLEGVYVRREKEERGRENKCRSGQKFSPHVPSPPCHAPPLPFHRKQFLGGNLLPVFSICNFHFRRVVVTDVVSCFPKIGGGGGWKKLTNKKIVNCKENFVTAQTAGKRQGQIWNKDVHSPHHFPFQKQATHHSFLWQLCVKVQDVSTPEVLWWAQTVNT